MEIIRALHLRAAESHLSQYLGANLCFCVYIFMSFFSFKEPHIGLKKGKGWSSRAISTVQEPKHCDQTRSTVSVAL